MALGLGFWVGLPCVLCILSAPLCIACGPLNGNKCDRPVTTDDVT